MKLVRLLSRAGFTLSRALFRKKNVGPFNWGIRPYFPWKKWRPFLVITVCVSAISCPQKLATFFCSSLSFHSRVTHFSGMQKYAAPFMGPLFGQTCWTCLNPPLLLSGMHTEWWVLWERETWHPPVRKFFDFWAQKGEFWCILGATFAVELNENWLGYWMACTD